MYNVPQYPDPTHNDMNGIPYILLLYLPYNHYLRERTTLSEKEHLRNKKTHFGCRDTLGLLLGTSPITPHGARNFYFENRIKAAAELYHAGKIKKILASGGDYTMK